jgi:hypothetical protein
MARWAVVLGRVSGLVVASPDDPSADPELEASPELGQADHCPIWALIRTLSGWTEYGEGGTEEGQNAGEPGKLFGVGRASV